jgi:hypothetical protein
MAVEVLQQFVIGLCDCELFWFERNAPSLHSILWHSRKVIIVEFEMPPIHIHMTIFWGHHLLFLLL